MRQLSVVGAGGVAQRLWDVANVEAHVRATLDSALEQRGARLNPQQYQRAFAFMWSLCWELSGLEQDGCTHRFVFEVRGFLAPRGRLEQFRPIKLPQFARRESAELALAELERRQELVFSAVERVRPRGAYDATLGLGFVTYSRRVLTKRLTDWYRSDPEFGDNRYAGNRLEREVSLEWLAEQRPLEQGADDASFLDRRSPGSRDDFVDELNRHAYTENVEEFLMRATDHREERLDAASG